MRMGPKGPETTSAPPLGAMRATPSGVYKGRLPRDSAGSAPVSAAGSSFAPFFPTTSAYAGRSFGGAVERQIEPFGEQRLQHLRNLGGRCAIRHPGLNIASLGSHPIGSGQLIFLDAVCGENQALQRHVPRVDASMLDGELF